MFWMTLDTLPLPLDYTGFWRHWIFLRALHWLLLGRPGVLWFTLGITLDFNPFLWIALDSFLWITLASLFFWMLWLSLCLTLDDIPVF